MRLSILTVILSQICTTQSLPECSLYLAPSSIPNAGLGLYTTRHIASGQPILSYDTPDAPSILVTNSLEHNGGVEVTWSHVDYFWSASGLNEFESNHVEESVMTMGALSNYHTYLKNIKPHNYGYDDTVANRFTDPSAGAYSYYLGHVFKSSREIQPGEELFADYGESWLKTREGTFADFIPRSEHYDRAASVLKTMQLEAEKSALVYSDAILSTVKNVVNVLEPLAAAVLPTSTSDYHKLMGALPQGPSSGKESPLRDMISKFTEGSRPKPQSNGNETAKVVATQLAKRTVNTTQHSVEWVKQNGLCLENIIPGRSTLPLAGQGAFAARRLPKGSLISPAPLIQVPDRKSLLTYELIVSDDGKTLVRKNDEPIGSQLLLNYCFGHEDSRLLLCPQTNVILINHCSSRKAGEGECGTKGPNAKIQWAGSWDPSSSEWLKKSLEDIDQLTVDGLRGLSFDFIATRDIQQGEEIFIDYGQEWEKAWEDHINSWEPPSEPESGAAYSQLKAFLQGDVDVRTLEEQETDPYPENIITGCYYDATQELVDSTYIENEYHADGSMFAYDDDIHMSNSIYACEILRKQDDGNLTVKILYYEGFVDTPVVLRNYPLSSVTFRMRQRSSDQHLPGVFRHAIGIDDSMFPSQWKDGITSVKSEL